MNRNADRITDEEWNYVLKELGVLGDNGEHRRALTHDDCVPMMLISARYRGLDVIITAVPPLVKGPFTLPPMTCPHGVQHWSEPTGEQIAKWVREVRDREAQGDAG